MACAKGGEPGHVTDLCCPKKILWRILCFFLEIVSPSLGKPIINEFGRGRKKEENAVYLNLGEQFQFSTVALKKRKKTPKKYI